ncbi:MAG: hypothetical protein ACI9E1_001187 [Cryomorphaceae bacterium]|jgi:hypothetical protein
MRVALLLNQPENGCLDWMRNLTFVRIKIEVEEDYQIPYLAVLSLS